MNEINLQDVQDLSSTSVPISGGKKDDPENEFFHSLYIAGTLRVNEKGVKEQSGLLQIRGLEFNLTEVNMIITHTKNILAKITKDPMGKGKLECFNYQNGNPKGTSGNVCGRTAAERLASTYCSECKSQLIVAGLLCDDNGNIKRKNNDPIFIFIRGKGTKYANIFSYLKKCRELDFDPPIISDPNRSRVINFEKQCVNMMRQITVISVGDVSTRHGIKNVFDLSFGNALPIEMVRNVLSIAHKTLNNFNEKFDWGQKPLVGTTYDSNENEGTKEASNTGSDVFSSGIFSLDSLKI